MRGPEEWRSQRFGHRIRLRCAHAKLIAAPPAEIMKKHSPARRGEAEHSGTRAALRPKPDATEIVYGLRAGLAMFERHP